MATLREFQLALQEKLEEIRQRDELICELEDELAEKELAVDRLKAEVRKLRALMSGGTYSSGGHHPPLLSVPNSASSRAMQGRHSSRVTFFNHRPSDATATTTLYAPPAAAGNPVHPRFRLPQPNLSSLRARMGLVKTYSAEPQAALSSSSSGESAENSQVDGAKRD